MPRNRNRSRFSQGPATNFGTRLLQILLVLVLLTLIGGSIYLGVFEIDPPTETLERPLNG